MSAKRTIFPPHQAHQGQGSENRRQDKEREGRDNVGPEDFFDDSFDFGGLSDPGARAPGGPQGGEAQDEGDKARRAREARGRAAYAGSEYEMPSFSPQENSFGPMGGLFVDDAGGPVGHGLKAQQAGDGLLGVVTDEALGAECAKRICPSCPTAKQAEEARLRALAELDNARKRLAREKDEQVRFASEAVLNDLLPSLDNLDLALQHAGAHEACRDFVVGVEMTRKSLQESLARHGLARIGEVGEEFDPAVHEAVGMVKDPKVAPGCVSALLSNGYKLNERLLRPARVMVSQK
ncbi:nucleotide exchange factor GrpE [Desulfovibrio sp. OttesenSCG-928-A18]|nr:nucleotide exchange factor GrpE [Desulfovibrio sp. OttesenSCG-928-A18]